MKFVCLSYADESKMQLLPKEELEQCIVKFGPFEICPADEQFMKMVEARIKKAVAK